jgi:hypothetical protein
VNLVWLSADPVVEGALGVTDRIEGARYFARRGDRVLMVTGGANDDRPCDGVPTRIVPARYVPFIAWLTLWPRVLQALQDLPFRADAVIYDFGLLPPAMRWRRTLAPASRPAVVLDVRSHPVEAGALRLAAQRARFAMTLRGSRLSRSASGRRVARGAIARRTSRAMIRCPPISAAGSSSSITA